MPPPKPLSVVSRHPNFPAPPCKLSTAGTTLWNEIQAAYEISDPAGIEILVHACTATDRLAALGAAIERDGEIVAVATGGTRAHPGLSIELTTKQFIARCFERLGLSFEPIKPIGRPPK